MTTEFLGYGADLERIELQKVHRACRLVYCEGNAASPFEFTEEKDARDFAAAIARPEKFYQEEP